MFSTSLSLYYPESSYYGDNLIRYIPSEKIGQNFDPLRNSFFVANYQHWTSTSALPPFFSPLDPWGALEGIGWFRGV